MTACVCFMLVTACCLPPVLVSYQSCFPINKIAPNVSQLSSHKENRLKYETSLYDAVAQQPSPVHTYVKRKTRCIKLCRFMTEINRHIPFFRFVKPFVHMVHFYKSHHYWTGCTSLVSNPTISHKRTKTPFSRFHISLLLQSLHLPMKQTGNKNVLFHRLCCTEEDLQQPEQLSSPSDHCRETSGLKTFTLSHTWTGINVQGIVCVCGFSVCVHRLCTWPRVLTCELSLDNNIQSLRLHLLRSDPNTIWVYIVFLNFIYSGKFLFGRNAVITFTPGSCSAVTEQLQLGIKTPQCW